LLLILLTGLFTALIALVLYKSEKLQSAVEGYYSDMAERTTDTLGNIALIQSFARIEMEVAAMRKVGTQLLGAQMPVLSWWALAAVVTRASTRSEERRVGKEWRCGGWREHERRDG